MADVNTDDQRASLGTVSVGIMSRIGIYFLIIFVWLTGFLTARCFAGTLVKSDGTIVERTYKPSYLVKNNGQLKDVKHTTNEWKKQSKKYEKHPLSHIKTWKPGYTIHGVAA